MGPCRTAKSPTGSLRPGLRQRHWVAVQQSNGYFAVVVVGVACFFAACFSAWFVVVAGQL